MTAKNITQWVALLGGSMVLNFAFLKHKPLLAIIAGDLYAVALFCS